jgi:small subunit ribosomal protein S6
MREYETVYVMQPQLTEAQVNQINAKVQGLIEKHGGRLFYTRSMGKRNLAYRIKKQTKGIYFCLDYAAGGGCVNEIEHNLMLDENVLRFLTTVRAEKIDVEARAAEIEARGEAAQLSEATPLSEGKETTIKETIGTKDVSKED